MIVELLEAAVLEALPRFVTSVGTMIAIEHQPSARIEVAWWVLETLTVGIYVTRFGHRRLLVMNRYPIPRGLSVPDGLDQIFRDVAKYTQNKE